MAGKIQELLNEAGQISDSSVNDAERAFANDDETARFFDQVKQKMLDVREWDANSSASRYALFDAAGTDITGEPVEAGTFIRIALYASGKYDWVTVTHIHETTNEFVISVKPAHDTTERPPRMDVTSHFFQPTASNNFCLQRAGKVLKFYVIGLNEGQNTEFTSGLIETARNFAAANLGYYLGIQKTVWTEFCSNMLELEKD